MAFTPILLSESAHATDETRDWEYQDGYFRGPAYRMVLRVAKPLSTGSGVPVASPWESRTPIVSSEDGCDYEKDFGDGSDGNTKIWDGKRRGRESEDGRSVLTAWGILPSGCPFWVIVLMHSLQYRRKE